MSRPVEMLLSEKCDEGCVYATLTGFEHNRCTGSCAALEEDDRDACRMFCECGGDVLEDQANCVECGLLKEWSVA